ncbi:MAG: MBL fold metallo-hydrolase [Candidatus Heimdallarchaeota archaeon]|nr:MBL fold metallo-hydrolase [Candidatus Heimdallarchaeota archaeon]
MIFEKITSEGLAHNSYFLLSQGEVAIIDPRRDVDVYLDLANKHGADILHVFETHRNEDYVSGGLELAHHTGATIHHGENLDFAFGKKVKEGDTIRTGALDFGILETPGHTPESISITLRHKGISDDYYMVFTGDALFAGDVGRIDFYRDSEAQKEAAKTLYDSLFNKILPLGDHVLVMPAHGAGSVCGGGILGIPYSTIGFEKKNNAILQKTREEFIEYKSQETFPIAPYMAKMEEYNKDGPPILQSLPFPKSLKMKGLKQHIVNGAQIVDVRKPSSFSGGHVPKSLNIWQSGLPLFAGWLLNYEDPIVIVKDAYQKLDPIIRFLVRLGYDKIVGYLSTFSKWFTSGERFATANTWTVHRLQEKLSDTSLFILDVRDKESVEKEGKIPGAKNIFLGQLEDQLTELPKDKHLCVYCDSGFKTSVAVSILMKESFEEVTNILGGFHAWENAGFEIEK